MRFNYLALGLCFLAWCSPGPAAPTFGEAYALYTSGQYVQARQAFLEFVQANPHDPTAGQARFHAVLGLFWLKDYDGFVQDAGELLRQEPLLPQSCALELRYHLAFTPFVQGKWAEARGALEAFAAANPGADRAPWAQYYATLCLFHQGDYGGFQQAAGAFLQQHPAALKEQVEELQYHLAFAPFRQSRWAEARASLQAFAAAHPAADRSFALWARSTAALCLFFQDDYGGFQREAEAFIAQHPAAPREMLEELQYQLAFVPLRKNLWQEAAEPLRQILARDLSPHHRCQAGMQRANALLICSRILRQAGNVEQADAMETQGMTLVRDARAEIERALLAEQDGEARFSLEVMRIESWYFEEKFPELAQAAQKLSEKYAGPSRQWATGMAWLGIARVRMRPRDREGAAEALDAVLLALNAWGPDSAANEVWEFAAMLRAGIALKQNDPVTARVIVQMIQLMPESRSRTRSLKYFSRYFPDVTGPMD